MLSKLALMLTFGDIGGTREFDPLIFLLFALAADAYLGGFPLIFRWIRHPVSVLGDLIGVLDRKLNRESRSQTDRAMRGALAVLVIVGLCLAVGLGVAWLSFNHPLGWIVETLLLVMLMAQRGLYDHVKAVAFALEQGSLESARTAVFKIVGRVPHRLDKHGVARAAIESCAENFNDGVVAPIFWYVLFGFPGLLVYKAVNTMDSMIGRKTSRYRAFGMVAARLDDVLSLIPARLSGLFLVLAAAFVPTASISRAFKIMWKDASRHRSANAGWPESAVAGALNLALAGPRSYAQSIENDPWIGDGVAKAGAHDIRLTLYLYVVACLINGMWVAAIALIRLGF